MRRRTLLATTGALLFAGCSGLTSGPDAATDTEPGAGPGTGTDADTPAPTGTESPTGTETLSEPEPTTDTATDTDTETPTETETATPSEAEREAADRIDDARADLSRALSTYVGFAGGDGPTLLDVDASVKVTVSDVTNPVGDARDALDEVPDGASAEQRATVEALRGVATFLDRGVRCQAELYDAYGRFTFVVDRIYAENTGGVADDLAAVREESDRAGGYLDTITAETSASDAGAFDGVDEGTYTDKVDQFRRAVDAFPDLADALAALESAVDTFGEAADAYEGEDYRDGRELFPEAAGDFRSAGDTLAGVDAPGSVADAVADLSSVAGALAPACDDLAAASRAGFEGDSGDREDAFAAAQEHMRSSDVAVERLDSVQDLLDD